MWGLQHRPRVTCRPVCMQGGYNTDRVSRAVLSVCRGVTTGQHITRFVLQTPHPQHGISVGGGGVCNTDCCVLSCLWGLDRVGCYNTDRVFTCHPVCRGWIGWGGGLQGGYNRTAHNMVYLWGGVCNTDCVACRPVGWGGGLQHRPHVM